MLSLLGMVLAIGLVVDDAIVVVENVERQLEAGLPPLEAARKAWSEVTGPIIATTAVLLAVCFYPPSPSFRASRVASITSFALTVAISVGISAFQLADLKPSSKRRVSASRPRKGSLSCSVGSTRASNGSRTFTRVACGSSFASGGRWSLSFFCFVGGAYMLSRSIPTTFCRLRTRAILCHRAIAGWIVARSAPDAVGAEGARSPAGDAGRPDCRLHQRPQTS